VSNVEAKRPTSPQKAMLARQRLTRRKIQQGKTAASMPDFVK